MIITRTKEGSIYLYEIKNDNGSTTGKMSLNLLVRCHAKDFNYDDIKQVASFIHDEIFELKRGVKHKLEMYGLYDALYYGHAFSDMAEEEAIAKIMLEGQKEFITWLYKMGVYCD